MSLKSLFELARQQESSSTPAVLGAVLPKGKPPLEDSLPWGIGTRTDPTWHYLQAYLEVHLKFKFRDTKLDMPSLVFGENLAITHVGSSDPEIAYLGEEHGLSSSEAKAVLQKVKEVKEAASKMMKGVVNMKKVAFTVKSEEVKVAKEVLVFLGTPYVKYDFFEWADVWATFVFGPSTVKLTLKALQTKMLDKALKHFWIRDAFADAYDYHSA